MGVPADEFWIPAQQQALILYATIYENSKIFNINSLTLSACGQSLSVDKTSSKTEILSRDTLKIYRNISSEFCNCAGSTMSNNKPSTTFDSCYNSVLLKYTDSLKNNGFDTATQAGQLKLSNEFTNKLRFTCHDTYILLEKEWADGNAKNYFLREN